MRIDHERDHRAVTFIVLVALLATGLWLVPAERAEATHFRFRDLTWRVDRPVTGGATVVELIMRIADRRSYYGGLDQGSPFSASVATGDGGSANLTGSVVSVNPVDDWFIAEARGVHTYAGPGPYEVSWSSCCTLSSLRNSPDSSLRTTTVVNLAEGTPLHP